MAARDPLAAARAANERRRAAGELVRLRTPAEKLAEMPHSLRRAIDAKCFDCVGGKQADHGYHRAVRECPATRCPLHGVRGWQ